MLFDNLMLVDLYFPSLVFLSVHMYFVMLEDCYILSFYLYHDKSS